MTQNTTTHVYVNNVREYEDMKINNPDKVYKVMGDIQIFFAIQLENITDARTAMKVPLVYQYRMGDKTSLKNFFFSGDVGISVENYVLKALNAGLKVAFYDC